ncbi:hypothetical protein HDU96_001782 [Phlyctochytrium bullatum]|nr:hypothetical protein HDU96_001782 [Phlyctochytrium bullatum]
MTSNAQRASPSAIRRGRPLLLLIAIVIVMMAFAASVTTVAAARVSEEDDEYEYYYEDEAVATATATATATTIATAAPTETQPPRFWEVFFKGAESKDGEPAAPKSFAAAIFHFIFENIYSILVVLPLAVMLWWKSLLENTATGIVSSKDGSGAPMIPITTSNLSREPLTSPARLLEHARNIGGFYVNFVLGIALTIIADAEIARVILSERFRSERHVYNAANPGLLAKNGSEHARLRKPVVTALTDAKAARSLATVVQQRLKAEIFPELDEASKESSFDLNPVIEELVADALVLWVTGLNPEDKKAVAEIIESRRTLADLNYVLPTGITWWFDRIRDTMPLAEYVAFFPGTLEYHKRRTAKRNAAKVFHETLAAAKQRREADGAKPEEDSLLYRLMEASEASEKPLSWEEIVANIEAVQWTAEGTLISLVSNLLYLLSHDKATQKQIQAELQKVPRSASEPLRADDLRPVTTLDLAVKEALRVLPPQPISYNRSSLFNVYKLPGMWALPAGSHLVVDYVSVQRSLTVFGDDADQFRPSRFKGFNPDALPPAAPVKKSDDDKTAAAAVAPVEPPPADGKGYPASSPQFVGAYMPFGGGPFACPGQRIALDFAKQVVAEVLRRYELAPVPLREGLASPTDLKAYKSSQGGQLRHAYGAPVVVKKRKAGK